METNIVIAIIASSAVVISFICIILLATYGHIVRMRRFDKVDDSLLKIENSLMKIREITNGSF